MDIEKLIQLTEEQRTLLNEISERLEKLRHIGGQVIYDRYNGIIYAYNTLNTEDFTVSDSYERGRWYPEAEWKDITDHLTEAPFYIDDMCIDDDMVLVKVKRNKNLF